MRLPDRPDAIERRHIEELMGEAESESLEFKSQLPSTATKGDALDEAKRELCRDFTSLANTSGGHIVYGIREDKDHRASVIQGIPRDEVEDAVARISESLRSGTDPPLATVAPARIEVKGGFVLVFNVQPGWRPHFVKEKGGALSLQRRAAHGKHACSPTQVYDACVAAETLPERIRTWRQSRIEGLLAGRIPPAPPPGQDFIVVHVVPHAAVMGAASLSVSRWSAYRSAFGRCGVSWTQFGVNVDGMMLTAGSRREGGLFQWCQVFRDGRVELGLLGAYKNETATPVRDRPPASLVYPWIRDVAKGALEGVSSLGCEGRAEVMVTVSGMKGCALEWDPRHHDPFQGAMDRDLALIATATVEQVAQFDEAAIRSLLDGACEAFGRTNGCPYYNQNGEWLGDGWAAHRSE